MVHYQIIHCRHCDGTNLQKNGMSLNGTQRWFCKECNRYFRLEYRYNACKKGVREKIVEMTLNSSGVRDTGRVLGVSKDTVTSVLKKLHQKLIPVFCLKKKAPGWMIWKLKSDLKWRWMNFGVLYKTKPINAGPGTL